jgi:acyl-coenzyme A synthetase/AMP-(fatty) acid ligase
VTAADRISPRRSLLSPTPSATRSRSPLRARATTYLHPGWPDPAAIAAVMREVRPTLFFSVPTVYARLLHADLPAETRSARASASRPGERLPPEIYAA